MLNYINRNKKSSDLGMSENEVDWTHRFEVRGHWRKISGLGKNRQGEYVVSGSTWVKDHVRGEEHLPLIKKIRLVETMDTAPL